MKLMERREVADDTFELSFIRPKGLQFKPGQHIRFHHDGIERDYTPISRPDDDTVQICIKKMESHSHRSMGFSSYLTQCPIGESLEISGPYGHFLYHPTKEKSVFIAAGTGVAPFVAFARSEVWEGGGIFLHGARNEAGLLYGDLLSCTCDRYIPCFSDPAESLKCLGYPGRVTDYLKQRFPKDRYQFYICGKREMILDAMAIIDERFPDSRVYTERFS